MRLDDAVLVGREGALLLDDRGRHGELADVVEQEPEAELEQAALDVVAAPPAAEVLPAATLEEPAADEQPERADVDRVLVGVRVGRREVREHERYGRAVGD